MNFVWFCFFVKFSPYWNAFPEFGLDQPLIAQCRRTTGSFERSKNLGVR